jgi:hypothetical protein
MGLFSLLVETDEYHYTDLAAICDTQIVKLAEPVLVAARESPF